MLPWTKITHLGDTSLIAPAALLIGLWLLVARRHRLLFWWCALLTWTMLLVAGSKIAFIGWGIGIPTLNFTGISGHTTFAMAVWPVLAFLLLQRSSPLLRAGGVVFALSIAVLVGFSRLVLQFHSTAEVVAGYLLGATVSIVFIWISGSLRHTSLSRMLLATSLAALLAASSIQAAPTQYWLIRVALYVSGHEQPFVRSQRLTFPVDNRRAIRLAIFHYQASDGPAGLPKKAAGDQDSPK
ncbi:MAG TPA: phosphatase PAP2 family protein [Burkholderiaceae bacterium]|nr:phosphatase PAP2 family protein [Burkholderiaceae bacterium]